MNTKNQNKKCEFCGTLITHKYGSGRFCSEKCARSFATRKNRDVINHKISQTLKNKYASGEIKIENSSSRGAAGAAANHDKKMKRFVKSRNGDTLNITYGQLEQYRQKHSVCEICGRRYNQELCTDHNHKTKKFRGLLCSQCNRSLGWYENNKELVEKYLAR